MGAARRSGGRLRHLRGLRRVELRPRRGRLGRAARRHDHHGGDVPLHGVRAGRAVLRDLHNRWRLRLRPAGPRAVGRLPDRHRDPGRVRHRPGRDRELHQRLRRLAHRHQRSARLPGLLRPVRGTAHLRRGRGAQADVRHHRDRRRGAAHLRGRRRPQVRPRQPDGHAGRRRGGREHVPAVRAGRHLGRPAVRDLVLPRRRGRAPGRRGDQGPRALDAEGHHRRHADAAGLRRADPRGRPGRRRLGSDPGLGQPARRHPRGGATAGRTPSARS